MKKLLVVLFLVIALMGIFAIVNRKPEVEPTTTPVPLKTPEATITAVHTPYFAYGFSNTLYAPLFVDNVSFFTSGWTLQNNDGVGYCTQTYNSAAINVTTPGANQDSISYYRDGLPLIQGNTYTVSFDSVVDLTHDVTISVLNADSQEVISTNSLTLEGTNSYSYSFTMNAASIWNGRFAIGVGKDNTNADTYNITINNLRIVSDKDNNQIIKVNQVGYYPNEVKRCVFPYNAGDFFDVVDVATGQVVYSGAILREIVNATTGETNYYGDFSNVTTVGDYYVRAQVPATSYQFTINTNVYDDLLDSLTNMLYSQRCGSDLSVDRIGSLSHGMCHNSEATIYGLETTMDASGGWHDAGDYGRYVKTGTKATNDLLLAYLSNANYTDSIDLLSEAKYELDWLFKMQNTNDGSVYSKVMTASFPGDIAPEQDTQPLYVFQAETCATGDFAQTMALAYITFKGSDEQYANKCLDAAKKAYAFLQATPDLIEYPNPEGVTGGNYTDSSDADERFAAALSLYVATGDENYLTDAKAQYAADNTVANSINWHSVGGYARYMYLLSPNIDQSNEFYAQMRESLVAEANILMGVINNDGYFSSITSYNWGSNGDITNNANLLMMAFDVTGDTLYREAAGEQLNYLLGTNSLNMSFVTGFGTNYPSNVHSRVAKAFGTQLLGALVGGPNSSREDNVTGAMSESVPPAKVYADDYNSFSTNEISIYWNSSLIYLILQFSK